MSIQTTQPRAPVIDPGAITEMTDGVWVIPDSDRTPMVPNIGIVVGARATLVIDTGFGPDNARTVVEEARRLSDGHPVFLTHTHCHPEHGFGANAVAEQVTIVERLKRFQQLQPELVVPGHGLTGGPERIANYLAYLELAKRRVDELRAAGELSEGEIVDRVSTEVLGVHPDWENQIWARKAVEDLTWPARALPRGTAASGRSEVQPDHRGLRSVAMMAAAQEFRHVVRQDAADGVGPLDHAL